MDKLNGRCKQRKITQLQKGMRQGQVLQCAAEGQVSLHFYETLRTGKSTETECRGAVAKGCGRGWGEAANEYRISFWDDGSVLELDTDDGCTIFSMY